MNKLCRVLVLAGVLAGIAQPAKADVGQHCAFRLVPLESDGVVTDASLDLVGCFATYEAALEAGIGQGVDVGAAVTPVPSGTTDSNRARGSAAVTPTGSSSTRTSAGPSGRAHRIAPTTELCPIR